MKYNILIILIYSLNSCTNSVIENKKVNVSNYERFGGKFLGLKNLENGVEDLEVRIWYGVFNTDEVKLIHFKREKNTWVFNTYLLIYIVNKKGDKIKKIKSEKFLNLQPKSGWQQFNTKSDSLIQILKTAPKNLYHNQPTSCDAVTVEFNLKNEYKSINYPCINSIDKFKDVNSFITYLEYLDYEFGLQIEKELFLK